MEYSESTKVVFQRIEKVDPENVSKIIGYLLLKDQGELEMIRLALGPDNLILSLIDTAKRELHSLAPTHALAASKLTPRNNFPWIPPLPRRLPPNSHYIEGNYVLQNQPTVVVVDDRLQSCKLASICQSFSQGYCKYGGGCQFLHIFRIQNGCFMVLNPPEDHNVLSIEQLEMELIGLLKARRGVPVSISSVPIFYYDKYGQALPVEGHLLEGKVRFTLVQLVAQMTKGIHVVDGAHGRQSIILAEDMGRWMEEKKERESVSCSQVYMTFPPHTMFSEEDVYNYFNNFGPVQEVRLPNQEKRMFGFVTFVYSETVTLVLTKTNPHFICGAKVLVKPYRRKPLLVDGKRETVEKEDPHSPLKQDSHLNFTSQRV